MCLHCILFKLNTLHLPLLTIIFYLLFFRFSVDLQIYSFMSVKNTYKYLFIWVQQLSWLSAPSYWTYAIFSYFFISHNALVFFNFVQFQIYSHLGVTSAESICCRLWMGKNGLWQRSTAEISRIFYFQFNPSFKIPWIRKYLVMDTLTTVNIICLSVCKYNQTMAFVLSMCNLSACS